MYYEWSRFDKDELLRLMPKDKHHDILCNLYIDSKIIETDDYILYKLVIW